VTVFVTLKSLFRPQRDAWWLFVLTVLVVRISSPVFPLHGDAYYYTRSIETFEGGIVHGGYYLLGYLCHLLPGKLGATPLQTLAAVSLLSAGIAVAAMRLFVFEITGSRLQAMAAALILLGAGAFWLDAVRGVPYAPQLALILLSLVAAARARPLTAGLLLLAAITITPTRSLPCPPPSASFSRNTKPHSKVHRDGDYEPTKAYPAVRRGE
jgi:hypothetical protein